MIINHRLYQEWFDIYCKHSRGGYNHKSQALPRMVLTFTVNIAEDSTIINHNFCKEWF